MRYVVISLTFIHQLLPENSKIEDENARMTTEQLKELGEALSILSAKSSVLQERDELRSLMEENLMAEEVIVISSRIMPGL